jgi:FtsZ-interacting cell division protein ZipA
MCRGVNPTGAEIDMKLIVIIVLSAGAIIAIVFYAFLAFSVREHEKYFKE